MWPSGTKALEFPVSKSDAARFRLCPLETETDILNVSLPKPNSEQVRGYFVIRGIKHDHSPEVIVARELKIRLTMHMPCILK